MENKKQVISDGERRENAFIFALVFLAFVFIAALLVRWAGGFRVVG